MSETRLGKTPKKLGVRDAVHVPVIAAVAGARMLPGDRVSVGEDGIARPTALDGIGIVDPFLCSAVATGSACWVCLYPGSIESLRHNWTHVGLDGPMEVRVAMEVIADMAGLMGLSYYALMGYASDHALGHDDGYVTQRDGESWRTHFNEETFWPAYETVTGRKVDPGRRDHFFSCSC